MVRAGSGMVRRIDHPIEPMDRANMRQNGIWARPVPQTDKGRRGSRPVCGGRGRGPGPERSLGIRAIFNASMIRAKVASTATALGLTIPETLLATADEVIQ